MYAYDCVSSKIRKSDGNVWEVKLQSVGRVKQLIDLGSMAVTN
jgi:hypothetical protein